MHALLRDRFQQDICARLIAACKVIDGIHTLQGALNGVGIAHIAEHELGLRIEIFRPLPLCAVHLRREIVNAIFYVLRTGCQWRMLPHDLPPWQTVYTYFRNWRRDGTWQRIHDTLRRQVRQAAGRHPQPSAAILDSQSVKTTEKGGHAVMMRGRKQRAEKGIF